MFKRKIFDFNSIYVKLLLYFMLFAIVIIFLIGGMEIFLFNNFYGTMKARDTGKLADIAPTLLTMMGLEVPSGMEGDVLV